jgi:plasmid stabilization system protein ParE
MAHSLSPRAQADIDEIAYYIAAEGGSPETAHGFLESIYRRFLLLGQHPYAGRRRDDLRPGKAHWGAIAGADFFTTEVWTWRGLVTYYTVFVIDLASRRCRSSDRRRIRRRCSWSRSSGR